MFGPVVLRQYRCRDTDAIDAIRAARGSGSPSTAPQTHPLAPLRMCTHTHTLISLATTPTLSVRPGQHSTAQHSTARHGTAQHSRLVRLQTLSCHYRQHTCAYRVRVDFPFLSLISSSELEQYHRRWRRRVDAPRWRTWRRQLILRAQHGTAQHGTADW